MNRAAAGTSAMRSRRRIGLAGRALLAIAATTLAVAGTVSEPARADDGPTLKQLAVMVLKQAGAEPRTHGQITDRTGVALTPLLESFTDEELAAAEEVVINWAPPRVATMVPDIASLWGECEGAARCVLINRTWWTASGWADQQSANRAMLAHEFAHILSAEREPLDRQYALVDLPYVDGECLADAVARHVLARGGWRPPVTEDYDVSYQCEAWWIASYGESRLGAADALAADLLEWAAHRYDPPVPATSDHAAAGDIGVASAPATRGAVAVED